MSFGLKPKPKPTPQNQCTHCGKGQHSRDKCPAKEATCHRCHRKGHFSTQCFSKSVAELSSESHLDTAFLDTVSSTEETSWLAKIQLCGQVTEFKLDTGAEVTAISEHIFHGLGKQKLISPKKVLYGPSRQPLQAIGFRSGYRVPLNISKST